jgi:hypothetical protein
LYEIILLLNDRHNVSISFKRLDAALDDGGVEGFRALWGEVVVVSLRVSDESLATIEILGGVDIIIIPLNALLQFIIPFSNSNFQILQKVFLISLYAI